MFCVVAAALCKKTHLETLGHLLTHLGLEFLGTPSCHMEVLCLEGLIPPPPLGPPVAPFHQASLRALGHLGMLFY